MEGSPSRIAEEEEEEDGRSCFSSAPGFTVLDGAAQWGCVGSKQSMAQLEQFRTRLPGGADWGDESEMCQEDLQGRKNPESLPAAHWCPFSGYTPLLPARDSLPQIPNPICRAFQEGSGSFPVVSVVWLILDRRGGKKSGKNPMIFKAK